MSMVIFLTAISKFVMQYFIDAKFMTALNYMPLLILASAFSAFRSFLGAFFY